MPDDRPVASPVFVDPTGRRRRTVRTVAILGAGSVLGPGALLVAALLGAPIGPTASLPDPVPAPPPAIGQSPQPPPAPATTQPTATTPTSSPGAAPGGQQPGVAPVTTTTPVPGVTTTTATKGKPEHTPPGRPTGLPTPPGHTR